MTFNALYHDKDPYEIEQKIKLEGYLYNVIQSLPKLSVFMTISPGSGFLEVLLLNHLPTAFFKEVVIVEDPDCGNHIREIIMNNFSNKCYWLDGQSDSLSIFHNNKMHWFVFGLNMNFFNEWDFKTEFFKFSNQNNIYYLFIWYPHMGKYNNDCNNCFITTNIDCAVEFPFHVVQLQLDDFLNRFT